MSNEIFLEVLERDYTSLEDGRPDTDCVKVGRIEKKTARKNMNN